MKMRLLLLALIMILLSSCQSASGTPVTNQKLSNGEASPVGNNCPDGYPVKGNLTSKTGDKIYHTTGQDYYNKTIPEECYKTPQDAEKAGYRHSKR